MAAKPELQKRSDHRLAWTVITVTLLIFGAGLGAVTNHLRGLFKKQLTEQDGEVLMAATEVQQADQEGEEPGDDPTDLLVNILNASTVRGIVAVRLYARDGKYISSFPKGVQPGVIQEKDLASLKNSEPVSYFRPTAPLSGLFKNEALVSDGDQSLPFIHALVPLKVKDNFIGAVEFILDGSNVAAALSQMERSLYLYALLIFVIGSSIATTALVIAFRRLQRSNNLLHDRTQHLIRANHELTMAAKTSAIGAVTAHLLHDLKNPLFGLQSFVSTRPGSDTAVSDLDWSDALQTTRRMQAMINDVVRILREETSESDYELSCEEILQLIRGKLSKTAGEREVRISFTAKSCEPLPNRFGNLVVLILTNLVQNALQAVGPGGAVEVECAEEKNTIIFSVADNGPGLPEKVAGSLFQPTVSRKEGGTGLGLAISKQLANHLGADLCLASSSSAGVRFELRFTKDALREARSPLLSTASA